MNFSEYDDFVFDSFAFPHGKTLAKPDEPFDLVNQCVVALNLGGEAGEVLDVIKKAMRSGGEFDALSLQHLLLELGDVLWSVSAIAQMYGLTLQQIASSNTEKLIQREIFEIIKKLCSQGQPIPGLEHPIFNQVRELSLTYGCDLASKYSYVVSLHQSQKPN